MSIYDKASLIQIPSGYKAGELYSVIPNSGAGDFTVTGDAEGDATRVNSQGLIETVNANVPRLDYPFIDGVVQDCPYLLLEPTRTNLLTYSEDFSQWVSINSTVLTNQAIAPDGSNNADKLTKNDAYGLISKFSVSISNSTVYSFSVFAKSDTGENITIRQASGSNDVRFYFNLSTQETASTGGGNDLGFIDSKIKDFGNGWYKCTLICTSNSNTGDFGFYAGRDGTTAFDGSVFIFGAQLEEGSYPTSYIQTEGSTVTRLKDECKNGGNADLFNDSEGVVFLDLQGLADVDATNRYITLSDGTATNSIMIQYRNSGDLRLYNGGTGSANLILSIAADLTERKKIAIQYGTTANNYKAYINGASQTISGSFLATSMSGLDRFRFDYVVDNLEFFGKVHQAMVFNEALSDSELQTLTTL